MHLPIPLLEAQYLTFWVVSSHIKGRSGVQIVDLEYLANMLYNKAKPKYLWDWGFISGKRLTGLWPFLMM